MIRWSTAKLDQLRKRISDATIDPIEARLASAELLAAEGSLSEAEHIVVLEFENWKRIGLAPSNLSVPFLTSLLIVNRLDLATWLLAQRHQLDCDVKLEINQPGSGQARIFVLFEPPELLTVTLDGSILRIDKTDIQVLWLDWIFPVFAHYMRNGPGERGRIMFSNWDDAVGPGLAMCANRPDCFLVPDNVFIPSRGYAHAKSETKRLEKSWDDRIPKAFWRGATTGQVLDTRVGWRSLPRIRLCEISRDHPDLVDAGISKVIQIGDPNATEVLRHAGLIRPFVAPTDFNQFKYQIDIDGNTNAWPGLFQKLLSGSPVLKVASSLGYKQWYYDRLKPWINFVPVGADMCDLTEKVKWLQQHDEVARKIGEYGRDLALSLSLESELDRSTKTIAAALRFFSCRPEFDILMASESKDMLRFGSGWDGFTECGAAVMTGLSSDLELGHVITQDDFILSLQLSPATMLGGASRQRFTVIVNGELLGQNIIDNQTTLRFFVAHEVISRADRPVITILHPNSRAVASQEMPLDLRSVSLVLYRLTLTAVAADPNARQQTSYLRARRPVTLLPMYGTSPPLEKVQQLSTWHGTYLYVDPDLEEVRHGPQGMVPANLYGILEDDSVFLYYRHAQGTWFQIRINRPASAVADPSRPLELFPGPQPFSISLRDNARVSLANDGVFLSAEQDGRLSLSKRQVGGWETFCLHQQ